MTHGAGSTTTHQAIKMSTLQDRLIKYMATLDRSISALELADSLKENPKSVRSRLTRMKNSGLIVREYRGHYRVKPRHGMGSPPRLQNLLVIATSSKNPEMRGLIKSFKMVRTYPSPPDDEFRVRIVFGGKRDNVHYTVKAPVGLDYYGLCMVHSWAESVVQERVGLSHLIWDVKNYELLWDNMGLRLEGVSVMTISDLKGTMEKYYNKFYGVRKEVRQSPESASLDEMVALMGGGVPQYQMTNQLAILVDEFNKFQNRFGQVLMALDKQGRVINALTKAIFKDLDERKK